MLIDMSGRVVHLWPRVRAVERARLGTDGRLLVIGTDDLIKEYDWDGRLAWRYRLSEEEDFPHHDVIWTRTGDVMVLARDRTTRADYLQEVDRSGRVVWQWWAADHMDEFAGRDVDSEDPTHVNSIRELPPNRWFDGGDARFRPGNLLVSARSLDTVFVIDRSTGEVVWRFSRRLDRQHEAVMIPKGQLGEGLVLLFNNGLKNRYVYRKSSILAVNPTTNSVDWYYGARYFYSSYRGIQQPLPNGNLMITSSQGGRVFEITPGREIVWQWTPPFLPMRPERYPPDHCPQLSDLGPAAGRPVAPRVPRPWVDSDLHYFAVTGEYKAREVAGKKRQIVPSHDHCRELVMPPRPSVHLGYGLDPGRLGKAVMSARFKVTIRPVNGDELTVLADETVSSSDEVLWRERWLPVRWPAYQRIEMCLHVEIEGDLKPSRARNIATVQNPRIYTGDRPSLSKEFRERELTHQEQALRERQLKELGYID
jgi:hypothetical protein